MRHRPGCDRLPPQSDAVAGATPHDGPMETAPSGWGNVRTPISICRAAQRCSTVGMAEVRCKAVLAAWACQSPAAARCQDAEPFTHPFRWTLSASDAGTAVTHQIRSPIPKPCNTKRWVCSAPGLAHRMEFPRVGFHRDREDAYTAVFHAGWATRRQSARRTRTGLDEAAGGHRGRNACHA